MTSIKDKKNFIYNESIKIIDNFYHRLEKINSLLNVEVFKMKIGDKCFFYIQDKENIKNNKFRMIQKEEFNDLKNKIKERKKLIKINKKEELRLYKNIKILNIIDKELANMIENEFFIYNLDAIPVNKRGDFNIIVVKQDKNFNFFYKNFYKDKNSLFYNFDNQFKEVFDNWAKGKIKAKEMQTFIKKKLLN